MHVSAIRFEAHIYQVVCADTCLSAGSLHLVTSVHNVREFNLLNLIYSNANSHTSTCH